MVRKKVAVAIRGDAPLSRKLQLVLDVIQCVLHVEILKIVFVAFA
jgi:hypothetical protein